jgi:predicted nucleic acid-binding protein
LLLVLDSNEYIFSFGFIKKPQSRKLLDIIVDSLPAHTLRIPRLVLDEVRRHLTSEEYKDFLSFVINITAIDENFVVPFELGFRYETLGLKPADSFIAAYADWVGADALVSENRHFLRQTDNLPFAVVTAEECLGLMNLPKG